MVKSLGRQATIAIAAAACLIVLAGGWFLLVKPVKADITATKAKTADQTAANDQTRLQVQVMRSIAKKLPAEQAELATLSQRIPDQVELPALLRNIQAVAKESGVDLGGIVPTQPTAVAAAAGIATVGVNLTVTGDYAEIEQFESALEGLKRTFLVTGFTLTGGASTAGSSSSSSTGITASLTGQALVHSTIPAAVTPTPTPSASTGH